MVRAVQSLRKTQTRRAMYPQPDRVVDNRFFRNDGREIVCPFGSPGNRLWVREQFAQSDDGTIVYAADPVKGRSRFEWQQSRYLPREASRLSLLVVSTRPQRLQEISQADARAEGYDESHESLSPIDWFRRLWDRLTPIESLRWMANPWLWVVHFKLIETNAAATPTSAPVSAIAPIAVPTLFDGTTAPQRAKPSGRTATIDEKRRLAAMLRTHLQAGQTSIGSTPIDSAASTMP
jgi:hypothetical protein